jgi:ABC-type dipeptide/oligopeptide/nickel transport system ATPase component
VKILEVDKLRVYFEHDGRCIRAVDGIRFSVERGEVLGIIGQSGSGKTVMAESLLRLIRPPGRIVSGKILFHGKDLLQLSRKDMQGVRGKGIFMVFQSPASTLNPSLTVLTQVSEILVRYNGLSRKKAGAAAEAFLERVGISSGKAHAYPFELSGGMRQRVLIAMALALEPEVLIADEATTGLDTITQVEILSLLKEWKIKTGGAMILITHDLRLVSRIADHVAVMQAGRIVDAAPIAAFFKTQRHPHASELIHNLRAIENPGGADRCCA